MMSYFSNCSKYECCDRLQCFPVLISGTVINLIVLGKLSGHSVYTLRAMKLSEQLNWQALYSINLSKMKTF